MRLISLYPNELTNSSKRHTAKVGLAMRFSVQMKEGYLDLFRGPLVQVDRLDSGYVHPQVPVDAGASYADKNSQIPRSPSWTWPQKNRTSQRST